MNLEVVVAPPARAARIKAAEQLSMAQLLAAYAQAARMPPEVLAAAEGVLEHLGHSAAAVPPATHIEFQGIELEGFGPFEVRGAAGRPPTAGSDPVV